MTSTFLVPSFGIIEQKLRKISMITPGIFEDARAQRDEYKKTHMYICTYQLQKFIVVLLHNMWSTRLRTIHHTRRHIHHNPHSFQSAISELTLFLSLTSPWAETFMIVKTHIMVFAHEDRFWHRGEKELWNGLLPFPFLFKSTILPNGLFKSPNVLSVTDKEINKHFWKLFYWHCEHFFFPRTRYF